MTTIIVKADPKNRHVTFKISKLSKTHMSALRDAMFDMGKKIKTTGKRRINNSGKLGKYYTYNGIKYRASAAGQDPANRSGAYKRSIDYTVRGYQELEFGVGVKYAKWLNMGTSRMKARPHLRRLSDDYMTKFVKAIYVSTNEKAMK